MTLVEATGPIQIEDEDGELRQATADDFRGEQGDDGPQGPQGPAGADSTVPGPQGPAGADGEDGAPGATGPAGPTGPAGADGAPGPKGDTGDPGPAGADGEDGATGPTGPQGEVGPQGPQGETGPEGPPGDDADATAAIEAHRADTTDVHGIPDTSALATDAEVADRLSVHTNELGSIVSPPLTNPAITPLLTGSFTAKATTVLLDVDVSHFLFEPQGCHITWHLYYGPDGSVLTPVTQGASLAAGVVHKRLGATGASVSAVNPSVTLTGLTVGQVYDYEISAGVVGGAGALSITSAYALASSTVPTAWPNPLNIVAVRGNAAGYIIRAQHEFGYTDAVHATSVALTGAIGRVAITPDGTKAVFTNQGAHTVTVVNTGALTGAAPTAQGTYTITGTTPAPNSIAIDPTGTYAYVVNTTTGTFARVTIADGTVQTPVSLGIGTGLGTTDIVVSPDGANLYIVAATAGRVLKVRLSDNNITTATLANAACCVVSPDGTKLYVAVRNGASSRLHRYATSTLTSENNVAVGVAPFSIDILPDGRGLLIVSDTTTAGTKQIQHFTNLTTTMDRYVEWANQLAALGQTANNAATDVSINQNGCIYVANNTLGKVNIWFGGEVNLDPTSDYWADRLAVRALGAS